MDKADGGRRTPITRSVLTGDEWSEEERSRRQGTLGIEAPGEGLSRKEIEFVERFQQAGEQLQWIPKDPLRRPTNDFIWTSNGNPSVELKSPRPRYQTIHGRIVAAASRAAKQDVVKENFLIDLGNEPLTDELRVQLERFNVGRRKYRLSRLWVMSASQIHAIELAE